MKANDFVVFMQHFVAETKCSKEHPVQILMDNHESHLTIALIDYCRDNGIVLLTLVVYNMFFEPVFAERFAERYVISERVDT